MKYYIGWYRNEPVSLGKIKNTVYVNKWHFKTSFHTISLKQNVQCVIKEKEAMICS
jgi:hypothetical protein